jgi:peptidoglycan/xylan/chitin deacetylase (PgdA/CDA1 family)
VSPSWPASLSVTPEALEDQLALLARRGYRGVRFSDAMSENADGRVVAVTFDDGYRSVLELAKPILDRYGYPGTIFVPSDWPAAAGPMQWTGIDIWLGTEHEDELSSLGWQELRDLAEAGWEIGSHTCSHPQLPSLDEAALERELRESKTHIEDELGRPCPTLAYPYGSVDARVAEAVGAAGYSWAATIPRVLERPTALQWPRAPIYHRDDIRRFAAKVSPAMRRLRSSRVGLFLDRTRTSASQQA